MRKKIYNYLVKAGVIAIVAIFLGSTLSVSSVKLTNVENILDKKSDTSDVIVGTLANNLIIDDFKVREYPSGSWHDSSITADVETELEFYIKVRSTRIGGHSNVFVTVTLPTINSNPMFDYVGGSASNSDNLLGANNEELVWYYALILRNNFKEMTFRAKIKKVGTKSVDLTVFSIVPDTSGDPSTDSIQITGASPNNSPTAFIDSISPNPAEEGETVSFVGHGEDSDGTIIGYSWRSSRDGSLSTESSFSSSSLSVGTHTIFFKVEDDDGDWSTEKSETLIINLPNNSPTAFIDSISPNPAEEGETVSFVGHGEDSDGTIIGYSWRSSRDGSLSTESSFSSSSLSVGTHTIFFKVEDDDGDWSDEASKSLIVKPSGNNNPPNKPFKLIGPTSGKINTQYQYTTNTTDPDGDDVYYMFDWGNGSSGQWLGPYTAGDTMNAFHAWTAKGTYSIKVKAKDIHNAESEWSDPLPITMPKNKANNPFTIFLERLIERFSILEQILQPIYDKLTDL